MSSNRVKHWMRPARCPHLRIGQIALAILTARFEDRELNGIAGNHLSPFATRKSLSPANLPQVPRGTLLTACTPVLSTTSCTLSVRWKTYLAPPNRQGRCPLSKTRCIRILALMMTGESIPTIWRPVENFLFHLYRVESDGASRGKVQMPPRTSLRGVRLGA